MVMFEEDFMNGSRVLTGYIIDIVDVYGEGDTILEVEEGVKVFATVEEVKEIAKATGNILYEVRYLEIDTLRDRLGDYIYTFDVIKAINV